MVTQFCCILAVFFNLIMYFVFGSLITGGLKGRRFSATVSCITGFFVYFILFNLVCIPIMLLYRPLSLLAMIWAGVMAVVAALSAVLNRKRWAGLFRETLKFIREHRIFVIITGVLIFIEALVIIRCYQFTLDAAYYVGTASTSLFTDTIKIYDPYTGMWQDHFEMRYFLSNYAINDAVMCYLTGLHPLLWTKTVMEGTVVALVSLATYRLGRALFKDDLKKTGLFIFLVSFAGFFYSTIYTPQEFFVTRTYEGKTVLGALVLPVLLLVYIKLLEDHRDFFCWILLILISLGSLCLSNSAALLIPAALAIYMLPLAVIKKDVFVLLKAAVPVVPCVLSAVMYVLYVKGYFVIYTMPR